MPHPQPPATVGACLIGSCFGYIGLKLCSLAARAEVHRGNVADSWSICAGSEATEVRPRGRTHRPGMSHLPRYLGRSDIDHVNNTRRD